MVCLKKHESSRLAHFSGWCNDWKKRFVLKEETYHARTLTTLSTSYGKRKEDHSSLHYMYKQQSMYEMVIHNALWDTTFER